MKDSKGLRNFIKNIEPLMLKLKDVKTQIKLTPSEQHEIVQFYLETIHVLTVNPES